MSRAPSHEYFCQLLALALKELKQTFITPEEIPVSAQLQNLVFIYSKHLEEIPELWTTHATIKN